MVDRTTVLVLGTGELSSELVLSFQRLGTRATAVPAPTGAAALRTLIDRHTPQVVVVQSPAADLGADVVQALAGLEEVAVFPTPGALRLASDREALRTLAANELGLPTAPFWFAGSVDELTAVAEHAGLPLTITPVTHAANEGAGRSVLSRLEDVDVAWHRAVAAGGDRVMAETAVDVTAEFTMLTVRTQGQAGPVVQFCEPIGHRHETGGPLELWQPQLLSEPALDAARSIAARIVNKLGGTGLFTVDLLLGADPESGAEEVYFATVHPMLTGAGFVTTRSQRLSQFDLHARAILGLPVDTIMISPAAGEVSRPSADRAALVRALPDALAIAESDVRLSGEVCVALATAPDVVRARDRAHQVAAVLNHSAINQTGT
ncbi:MULTISPECIES: ATP-grasp domain-containing protein [unclassified Mycolicibacterium]|uniref:ATP-grasp domain-containing protein n=1 Tax=unclassified Mycolicibacterium TaxID=2636767 RepID=UPI0011DA724A|nr:MULTISPECIES: ATP-grasp domain-containing protein [unclassified Mycolicibacterium]TXH22593.1 MAG: ATP-grasp domain-containing protein [Mycobacterium sp.]